MGTLVNAASAYLVGNIIPKRLGTAHTSIVPYQGFPTKDGHIIIGALNDSQFQRLCKALDLEHLASDPNFLTNPSRVENRKELLSIFYERTKQKTTDEWIVKLEKAHVPCGPINTLDRVFNDPQVLHRNMLEEVEHPTAGKIKLTGLPVKFSETPASIRSAPPTLGQHTIQVLKQVLNYEDSKIYQLQKIGAITQI